ncbi:MAG: UDP-N-acetylglucosamine 1-carboxyvinyltransferase [Alphaproteobacteria bacterium]|nr:UDP-N-acetylglucosamine 1-carboxyvinyltransferase [Alphaproteobacteria bacterium]
MDRIRIRGGAKLEGRIRIGGAKNAALPLMAASLLTSGRLTLANLPHLADIATMTHLLAQHGVLIGMDGDIHTGPEGQAGRTLTLSARTVTSTTAPYDLVRKMRASVLVLGPLLARCGEAVVSLPGGCAIGTRPVNLHLSGLEQLGAEIELERGYIKARAAKGLAGAEIVFPAVSVGATENLMMAACLARGQTVLDNAACEPEIADLADCLIAMGARITGAGTSRIMIDGVGSLHGAHHPIMADRIEAGTFATAAVMTGGDVQLDGAEAGTMTAVMAALARTGASITRVDGGLRVVRDANRLEPITLETSPYPGFPTDMQAQFMALMCEAEGESAITETIFENRFMHVPELMRMGADIELQGSKAIIRGPARLRGAPVMATDLRASVSLVIAGLVAEGETTVNRVYHLDRGYERLVEKLAACGAEIERLAS